MLLGAAYPVLAVHDGDEWRRKLEPSVGDFVFNEAADYEVNVCDQLALRFSLLAPKRPSKRERQDKHSPPARCAILRFLPGAVFEERTHRISGH